MQLVKPEQVTEWQGRRIDVREYDEFLTERLEGYECVPMRDIPNQARNWDKQEAILLMCKAGMRSSKAGAQLEQLGFRNVSVVDGGVDAARSCGLKIIRDRSQLPIIRQVMIGAGSMVLAGLILAHIAHPWFIIASWMVGCGLILAGLTGFCPMASVLARMPWNRQTSCPTT